MRTLIAALLVAILMLSHGSVGPAHAYGAEHEHHEHSAAPAHGDAHHDAVRATHGDIDATADQAGKGDTGTVPAHNHVVGDQAPAGAIVATVEPEPAAMPLQPRSDRSPPSATVSPPLKPPSA